jgi:hypothetical protein
MHPRHRPTIDRFATSWRNWDPLQRLFKCKAISSQLGQFYRTPFEPDELEKIISLDIDTICARLFLKIMTPEECVSLLALADEDAQAMLDLLQTVRGVLASMSSFQQGF